MRGSAVAALLIAALLSCDRAAPEPTPAEKARAAREAAAARKVERVDRLLRRAGLLAKQDDLAEVEGLEAAWEAFRSHRMESLRRRARERARRPRAW